MQDERRRFLKHSGIVLSVVMGGELLRLSPAAARAADLPYQVLSSAEVATLEGLAEALVPGARAAGIAHYLDKQLAASPADSLLMLKYLGVPPADFRSFYQGALGSAEKLAAAVFGKSWPELVSEEAGELLAAIAGDRAEQWAGPPASFVFFVLRADACDVVYGTEQGFADIGMPSMAHIKPLENW